MNIILDSQKGLPIKLDVNGRWTKDDQDYTPYTNILSAAWPGQR